MVPRGLSRLSVLSGQSLARSCPCMQNPRVSLPSIGAREVRHENTRPTTRTARFFPVHKLRQTELTKDSRSKWRLWPLRPAVSCTRDGADWPKVVAVRAQQPISDFFGFIQKRDTINKRRTSPGSWSQELSSHTKINEIRQWRPKWHQFKKVVSLAGLHHIIGSAEALPIIGSAEALPILCVRYFRWERERDTERERERRKWRHHFRAIGDEFTLSLAKNSHNWRWAYTFPCQKIALFVSPFTLPVSPFT